MPRSPVHLQSAYGVALDASIGPSGAWQYLSILGIYPNSNGSVCNSQALTSASASCLWRAGDDGPFWVSDRTNIGGPNGDNNVAQSMSHWFDSGSYLVRHYNDATGGGTSRYFMCSGNTWPHLVSCDDSSGSLVCTCEMGYTGDFCESCDAGYQDDDGDGICDLS